MREKLLAVILGALLTFLTISYFTHRSEMTGCRKGVGGFMTVMIYQQTGQVVNVPQDQVELICNDLLRGQ